MQFHPNLIFYRYLAGKYSNCISTGLEYLNKGVVEKEQNVGLICQALGHAYNAIKDFSKAEEFYRRALEYDYEDKTFYEEINDFLGNVHMNLQQYDRALSYYKKSGDLAISRLGCTIKEIEKGLVQDVQLATIFYRIYCVYYAQGQYDTANNWLRSSAQLGNSKAQQMCIQNGIKFKVKSSK